MGAFNATPLNIYLVEILNAEPHQQNTISILSSLPWSLKLIFGFLSDSFPIRGMHRKPYLSMGALIYSLASFFYALIESDDILTLATCIFVSTLGLICFDVMADTMCVERSKFEDSAIRGQMQASCYSIRFFGSLLGAMLGTLVSNKDQWGWGLNFKQICFMNGFIPFVLILPWLSCLREKYTIKPHFLHKPKHHDVKKEVDETAALLSFEAVTTSYTDDHVATMTIDNKPIPRLTLPKEHHHHHHQHGSHPEDILVELQPFGPGARREMMVASSSPRDYSSDSEGDNRDEEGHKHKNNTSDDSDDDDEGEPLSMSRQLSDIWETVQLKVSQYIFYVCITIHNYLFNSL